ncbi:hypothetical protein TRFO_31388 [Tritrichomonas foetus]|uniref:Transmembrane protein n=1 Tax=Tritrichomonas foetus TaxID=1144522 RepID=A0A1J4JWP3_9EUKA|nr:hypothetical protein TRFO_31388 [Tritrichomonas foetus]|eukprot:OHT01693.1 hypothetical protein TRFO_31388 [Tritrichomonas foetus]
MSIPVDTYNTIQEHWNRFAFGISTPVFINLITHIFACRYHFLISSLSVVKLTWATLTFLGNESKGIRETLVRLFKAAILIGLCLAELWYKDVIPTQPEYSFAIFLDCFITFLMPFKFYYKYANVHIHIGGLLDNCFWIQAIIGALAAWKTHDPTTEDRMLPFALAYAASPLYYLVLYILEVYVLKK